MMIFRVEFVEDKKEIVFQVDDKEMMLMNMDIDLSINTLLKDLGKKIIEYLKSKK